MMIHCPFSQAYRCKISIHSNIATLDGVELWSFSYQVLSVLVLTRYVILCGITSSHLGFSSIRQREISVGYGRITNATIQQTILPCFLGTVLFESNCSKVWVESFINSEQRWWKLTFHIFSIHHFKQFTQASILVTLQAIVTSRIISKRNEFADELKSVEQYCCTENVIWTFVFPNLPGILHIDTKCCSMTE